MSTQLTPDQKEALRQGNGFLQLADDEPCVLISVQTFREMMGVGNDDDYQESLAAVEEGIAQVESGQSIPMAEFFSELRERYGFRC